MITSKMTPEQFADAAQKLKAQQGIELKGNAGELHMKGVSARYVYDGQELQIHVTGHPWLVTTSFCEGQIADELGKQGYEAHTVG